MCRRRAAALTASVSAIHFSASGLSSESERDEESRLRPYTDDEYTLDPVRGRRRLPRDVGRERVGLSGVEPRLGIETPTE